MVGFYGGLDERVNAGLPAFTEAMRAAGKPFEPQVYEGAAQAFFNDTRPSYNVHSWSGRSPRDGVPTQRLPGHGQAGRSASVPGSRGERLLMQGSTV